MLGVALLFWGGIAGRPFLGLLLAIAVEAAHWTRTRWDFSDPAFVRAWHASVVLFLVVYALVLLDSSVIAAFPRTISWLPVIAFPLQFVQSYGTSPDMPVATFSALARRRKAHAERHQLPFRDIRFGFRHAYLVAILLACALGEGSRSDAFFPGVVLLTGWTFLAYAIGQKRGFPIASALLIGISAVIAVGAEKGLSALYKRYLSDRYGGAQLDYARQIRTAIGELGEIKQSPHIIWRLMPLHGGYPKLLRVASYNKYGHGLWGTIPPTPPDTTPFTELDSVGVENPFRIAARGESDQRFTLAESATAESLPRFLLRGPLERNTLIPIPGNTASLVLPAQTLEINSFGTLRVEPEHAVANATVLFGPAFDTSMPPGTRSNNLKPPDLEIPEAEASAIARVARSLDLHGRPLAEKVSRIRNHFLDQFTYTRYLEKIRPAGEGARKDFVGRFLEEDHHGHCEYFATATALLLRETGVPTRYASGFAVVETHPTTREALIRGTHGHAWCLAWDNVARRWIDVDLTPPDWSGLETPRTSTWQPFLDWLAMRRMDVLVWRTEPGHLTFAISIAVAPLLLASIWIGRRLWKSRRRIETYQPKHQQFHRQRSPLESLEKTASKYLGPRPPGLPLTRWLALLLPRLEQPEPFQQAIQIHRELRFDPSADSNQLARDLEALLPALRRALKTASVDERQRKPRSRRSPLS